MITVITVLVMVHFSLELHTLVCVCVPMNPRSTYLSCNVYIIIAVMH